MVKKRVDIDLKVTGDFAAALKAMDAQIQKLNISAKKLRDLFNPKTGANIMFNATDIKMYVAELRRAEIAFAGFSSRRARMIHDGTESALKELKREEIARNAVLTNLMAGGAHSGVTKRAVERTLHQASFGRVTTAPGLTGAANDPAIRLRNMQFANLLQARKDAVRAAVMEGAIGRAQRSSGTSLVVGGGVTERFQRLQSLFGPSTSVVAGGGITRGAQQLRAARAATNNAAFGGTGGGRGGRGGGGGRESRGPPGLFRGPGFASATEFVAIGALGLATKAAITPALALDKAMAGVKAATQASGEEIEALRKKAVDLSITTGTSATEIAEGMLVLSRAGLNAGEVLSTIAPSLNLAVGAGENFGDVAKGVTDVIAQFGLKISDTQKVSDIFAKTLVSSKSDINDLIPAFAQVGSAAHNVGLSVEETAALFEILAQSGTRGSAAGTAIKNLIIGLEDIGRKEVLADLGVSASFLSVKMNGLNTVLQRLKDLSLSNSEASQIFQRRSFSPLIRLVAGGSGQFAKLVKEMQNLNNEAGRLAQDSLDNLSDRLAILKNQMLKPILELVTDLTPAIEGVAKTIGSLVSTDIGSASVQVVGSMAAIGFAAGSVMITLKGLIRMWQAVAGVSVKSAAVQSAAVTQSAAAAASAQIAASASFGTRAAGFVTGPVVSPVIVATALLVVAKAINDAADKWSKALDEQLAADEANFGPKALSARLAKRVETATTVEEIDALKKQLLQTSSKSESIRARLGSLQEEKTSTREAIEVFEAGRKKELEGIPAGTAKNIVLQKRAEIDERYNNFARSMNEKVARLEQEITANQSALALKNQFAQATSEVIQQLDEKRAPLAKTEEAAAFDRFKGDMERRRQTLQMSYKSTFEEKERSIHLEAEAERKSNTESINEMTKLTTLKIEDAQKRVEIERDAQEAIRSFNARSAAEEKRQLQELIKTREAEIKEANDKIIEANEKMVEPIHRAWDSMFSSMESGFANAFDAMIRTGATKGAKLKAVLKQLQQDIQVSASRMVAQQIASNVMGQISGAGSPGIGGPKAGPMSGIGSIVGAIPGLGSLFGGGAAATGAGAGTGAGTGAGAGIGAIGALPLLGAAAALGGTFFGGGLLGGKGSKGRNTATGAAAVGGLLVAGPLGAVAAPLIMRSLGITGGASKKKMRHRRAKAAAAMMAQIEVQRQGERDRAATQLQQTFGGGLVTTEGASELGQLLSGGISEAELQDLERGAGETPGALGGAIGGQSVGNTVTMNNQFIIRSGIDINKVAQQLGQQLSQFTPAGSFGVP